MYESAKATSQNSAGELEKQNLIYLDSFQARFDQIQAAQEDLYMSLIDSDSFKELLDVLVKGIELADSFVESIGGGGNLLLSLLPIITRMFSGSFAESITKTITNFNTASSKAQILKGTLEELNNLKSNGLSEFDEKIKKLRISMAQLAQLGILTNEEYNAFIDLIKIIEQSQNKIATKEEEMMSRGNDATRLQLSLGVQGINYEEAFAKAQESGRLYSSMGISVKEASEKIALDKESFIKEIEKENAEINEAIIQKLDYVNQVLVNNKTTKGKDRKRGYDDAYQTVSSVYDKTADLRQFLEDPDKKELTNVKKGLTRNANILADKSLDKDSDKYKQALANYLKYTKEYEALMVKALKNIQAETQKTEKTLKGLASGEGVQGLSEEINAATAGLDKALKPKLLQERIEGFINLTSNISMAASAINNLTNLYDIWNNLDLSFAEKLGLTFANISSSALLLAPVIKGAIELFKTEKITTVEIGKQTVLKTFNAILDRQAKKDAKDIHESEKGLTAEEGKQTAHKISQRVFDKKPTASKDKGQKFKIQSITKGNTKVEAGKDGVSNIITTLPVRFKKIKDGFGSLKTGWKAAKGAKGLKAAADAGKAAAIEAGGAGAGTLGSLGASLATILPVALPVAAAVAGISVAVYATVKAFNKQKDALEEANKRLQVLTQLANEAKESYDTLKSSIDGYSEAVKKLGELTHGTQEWKDALLEANNEATKMLLTYPELAKYMQRGENGVIEFKTEDGKDALDIIQQLKYAETLLAQNRAIESSLILRSALIEYDKEMLQRLMTDGNLGSVWRGMMNTAFGITGLSDLAALISGQVGKENQKVGFYTLIADGTNIFANELSRNTIDSILANLDEADLTSVEALEKALDKASIEIEDDDLKEEILDASNNIIALLRQIEENNRLLAVENAQLATNTLLEKGFYDAEATNLGSYIGGQSNLVEEEAAIAKLEEEIRNKGGNNLDLILSWAKNVMGLDLTDKLIKGSGGSNFEYQDANGEWVKVSYDTLAEELAKYRHNAQKLSEEEIKKYRESYLRLTEGLSSDAKEVLDKALANNEGVTGDSLEDYSLATIDELKVLIEKQSDELSDILKKALEETILNLEDYRLNLSDKLGWSDNVKESLMELANVSEWTLEEIERYSTKTLKTVGNKLLEFEALGADLLAAAETFLNKNFEGNLDELAKLIDSINWAAEDIDKELADTFREMGVELDYSEEATLDFIWAANRLNGDLLSSVDTWKKVSDVVKGLEGFGDSISKDDYEELYQLYGNLLNDYFVLMEDGTYALSVAVSTFSDAVKEAEKTLLEKLLKEGLKELLNATDIANNVEIAEETNLARWLADYDKIINGSASPEGLEGQLSYADLKNSSLTGVQNLDLAIATIGAWLSAGGDKANAINKKIQEKYKKDFKDLTEDLKKDIVELSGGNTVKLEIDGKRTSFDWSVIGNEIYSLGISNQEAKKDTSYYKDKYYSLPSVLSTIQAALNVGIISPEEAQSYRALALSDLSSRAINNSGNIIAQLKDKAKNANVDTSFVKDTALLMLRLAENEEERLQIWNDLKADDGEFNIDAELSEADMEYLETESKKAVAIKENTKAIEKYNASLELQNSILDTAKKELEEIDLLSELAYGKDKLKLIDRYNASLSKQNELLKIQLEINRAEASRIMDYSITDDYETNYEKAVSIIYGGVKTTAEQFADDFNNGGIIDTYDEFLSVIALILEKVGTGEGKITQEEADEAKDLLYQELYPVVDAAELAAALINQNLLTALEKNLEKIELNLEIDLDIVEANREWNDFLREMMDEDDHAGIANIYLEDFDLLKAEIGSTAKALEELKSKGIISDENWETLSPEDKQKRIDEGYISESMYEEKYRELRSDLMEDISSWKDIYDSVLEEHSKALEALDEAYEKQIGYYETIISLADHQRSINELLYGDKAYDKMAQYYETAVELNKNIVASNLDRLNNSEFYDEFVKVINGEITDEDRKNEIINSYMEIAESSLSALNELAAIYREQYINELNSDVESLEKELFGLSMDGISADWDWRKKMDDAFLDTVNAEYSIQKIASLFNSASRNLKSIEAQKKLNALRDEELAKLRDKDKLTQYDIDRAEKRLQIALAEIDLLNSLANKSSMRLMRQADGTYSYQYVADMKDLEEKSQKVSDLYNELYNFDKDRFEANLDEFYSAFEEYQSKVSEYWADGKLEEWEKADLKNRLDYLTELNKIANDVKKNYGESFEDITSTLGVKLSETDFAGYLANTYGAAWEALAAIPKNGISTILDNFNQTLENKAEEYLGNVTEIETLIKDIVEKKYGDGNQTLAQILAGWADALGNYETGLIKQLNGTADATSGLATLVEIMAEAWKGATSNLTTFLTALGMLPEDFKSLIAIKDASNYITNNSLTGKSVDEWINHDSETPFLSSASGKTYANFGEFWNSDELTKEDRESIISTYSVKKEEDKSSDNNNEGDFNSKYPSELPSSSQIPVNEDPVAPVSTTVGIDEGRAILRNILPAGKITESDWIEFQKTNEEMSELRDKMVDEDWFKLQEEFLFPESGFSRIDSSYYLDKLNTNEASSVKIDLNSDLANLLNAAGLTANMNDIIVDFTLGRIFKSVSENGKKVWYILMGNVIKNFLSDILDINKYSTAYPKPNSLTTSPKAPSSNNPSSSSSLALGKGPGSVKFDTGGYTGAWGPEGKLAMLHEKELVLNKFDTANILSAVDIISKLDNSMLSSLARLESANGLSMAAWEFAKDLIIEQKVIIDANFPNVNSRAEIEDAFSDILNLAAQHAYNNIRK